MERNQIIETASRLAQTMTRLTDVLDTETVGVHAHKTAELQALYRQKTNLLAEYAAGASVLREAGGEERIEFPAEISAALRKNSATLSVAMERNMKALAIAGEASRRVVDVIIDAVRQQRQSVSGTGYGVNKDGELVVGFGSEMNAQAVTLDTRL